MLFPALWAIRQNEITVQPNEKLPEKIHGLISTLLKVALLLPNSIPSPQFKSKPGLVRTAIGPKNPNHIRSGVITLAQVFMVTQFIKVTSMTTGDSALMLCAAWRPFKSKFRDFPQQSCHQRLAMQSSGFGIFHQTKDFDYSLH